MKRAHGITIVGLVASVGALAGAVGCSDSSTVETPSLGNDSSVDDGSIDGSIDDGSVGDGTSTDDADAGFMLPETTTCPTSCTDLGANCGVVTDTKCGGVVMCGDCPTGQTCGGGGTPNQCGAGSSADACVPQTCADQKIACGPAGDGCGAKLDCGTCSLPQTCGGDPAKPGQCGCTGTCALVPTCAAGTTTTFSGKVYDPAGVHPLANALVYIPNDPSDPGLMPFAAGITCDVCGATAAGNPLVSTFTAPDGSFTLTGTPVGTSIKLVVQLGRWRRQFTVDIGKSCAANTATGNLTMPKTHLEGDIPRIAFLTGGLDPVECTLRKMGIADSEFTNPGGGGYFNFYKALDSDPHASVQGYGAVINASTPSQSALFASSGGKPVINQYDMVILECEGYPQTEPAADQAALLAYANAGGRLFASDFAWSWLRYNGSFATAASWTGPLWGGGTVSPVNIDLVSNPKGAIFDKWLEVVGVSAPGSKTVASIYPGFHNTSAVVAPTQQWLYGKAGATTASPLHFTFNTPVGAASTKQCGRVVFSDWHAQQPGTGGASWPHGTTFPAECPSGAMTAQQTILEYMLFDLSACVQPYTPICTPRTCADAKVECGPASDGCGGLLDCGTCASGKYCGGGGPGVCGTTTTCTPTTCKAQGIECGPAGDGCGNKLDCGNCPTGQICGAAGPGKCGSVK